MMRVVLRNDTRAKAETVLSVVAFDEFISAAIYGLIGPRANMQADVRFIPKSRHVQCTRSCPLSANSGHGAFLSAGLNLRP